MAECLREDPSLREGLAACHWASHCPLAAATISLRDNRMLYSRPPMLPAPVKAPGPPVLVGRIYAGSSAPASKSNVHDSRSRAVTGFQQDLQMEEWPRQTGTRGNASITSRRPRLAARCNG